ncbi:MAG: CAP domain-containing protein [Bacillota bacterium]|nr:CAP domain-containing protein [Bacillota bacterium]
MWCLGRRRIPARWRLVLLGAAVAVFLCLGARPGWTQPFDISPEEERLVELTNTARSDQGLPPLRIAPELMRSAEAKARDMKERDYFAHHSPEGTGPFTLMREAGADFSTAGENLAEGPSADRIFAGWMKSDEQRRNILSREYTHLGIGVVSQNGRLIAVQHFARLRNATKD